MEAMNNTTEVVAVRHILEVHTIFGEIMMIARYGVALLALLINAFIAIAFLVQKWRRPTAVLVSPAGLLVLNLLFADAFVGAISIINVATFSSKMVTYPHWCSARLGVSYLAMIGSHIALINVAIDRFVAIKYTLQYRDWTSLTKSVVMICCGWSIPVAGLVGVIASNDWRPGLLRCSDIYAFKIFLWYVWIPSHVAAILCVIVIQCRVYICLRRHEEATATSHQMLRRFSQKSARILFRVTTAFVLCWGPFDVMLIIIVAWINQVIKSVYDATLVLAQLSFLVNPIVYSYQTANIRRPVLDLCSDFSKWLRPTRQSSARPSSQESPYAPTQRQDISVIGKGSTFQKSSSTSSVLTQITSTSQ